MCRAGWLSLTFAIFCVLPAQAAEKGGLKFSPRMQPFLWFVEEVLTEDKTFYDRQQVLPLHSGFGWVPDRPEEGEVDKLVELAGLPPLPRYADGYSQIPLCLSPFSQNLAVDIARGARNAPEGSAERARQLAYLKFWFTNQFKVNCADQPWITDPDLIQPPTDGSFPKRAEAEFFYQLGSSWFTAGYDPRLPWEPSRKYERTAGHEPEFTQAAEFYRQAEVAGHSPIVPFAAFMEARSWLFAREPLKAYQKLELIAVNKYYRAAHALASMHRDTVALWAAQRNMPGVDYILARQVPWVFSQLDLLTKIKNPSDDDKYLFNRSQSALEAALHSLEPPDAPLWFEDGPDSRLSPLFRHLYRDLPEAAWVQAALLPNPVMFDWIWASPTVPADHPLRARYITKAPLIAREAWRQFQRSGYVEWLWLAISWVPPEDDLAAPIAKAAIQILETAAGKNTQKRENLFLLQEMADHLLRIKIGTLDQELSVSSAIDRCLWHAQAESAGTARPLCSGGLRPSPWAWRMVVRWLRMDARLTLPDTERHRLDALPKSGVALDAELLQPATADYARHVLRTALNTEEITPIAATILDLLSTSALSDLAQALPPGKAQLRIARAVLARRIILKAPAEDLAIAAHALAKADPSYAEQLELAIQENRRLRWLALLAADPRLRPRVIAAATSGGSPSSGGFGYDDKSGRIDENNPNDNNWWCRAGSDELTANFFAVAILRPDPGSDKPESDLNYAKYWPQAITREPKSGLSVFPGSGPLGPAVNEKAQRDSIASAGFWKLVDRNELDTLAQAGSGPEFILKSLLDLVPNRTTITSRVLAKLGWYQGSDPLLAQALADGIRATRHGCRLARHGSYSAAAYHLLHSRFGDSAAAKATPYWFDRILDEPSYDRGFRFERAIAGNSP